ncbi:heme NO-binding domain-containing protein [Pseudoprimorskyibacter insulae]|uniref:Heme NO-binding domain-containing protein n=1 Tax=Pseudoprimorskyibacter insulae TaxID=1695997 RepID=A0A2R8APT3_9RHOB|nr:heme NO-binding domain-containing protein [Pseudoprimorskyibacter insulae]SPF78088.1 hypothetical protein PRI8871_00678 [Pseudoprimorskyibacter insulae]
MHGLVNRSIECFVRDSYGAESWDRVVSAANLGFSTFEAMLSYPDSKTFDVLQAVTQQLGKPRDVVLEDVGIYLVSHPNTQALRRLLRFAGTDFTDFLHSLDDLPDRARMAVPDLDLPTMRLRDVEPFHFALDLTGPHDVFGHVFVGIIRAMADDYGTLVLLEHLERQAGRDTISIRVIDANFADGRAFDLAGQVSGDQKVAE